MVLVWSRLNRNLLTTRVSPGEHPETGFSVEDVAESGEEEEVPALPTGALPG
jgi:hypothetical protein